MNHIEFIKTAMKDYRVGAVTKSSKYTAENIAQKIKRGARVAVEYGAGDGSVTKKILERLSPVGKLAAIEINEELHSILKEITDKRLSAIKSDVVSLSRDFSQFGFEKAEVVVSGIPFTFFASKTREEIVRNTARNLAPQGQFIVYQYTPLVLPLLKNHFKRVKIYYEIRNFLPYFIMVAEK